MCPRCGEPQNSVLTPSEDWHTSDTLAPIIDPDELARANAGPTWNCGYCGELNDGDTTTCASCDRKLDFDDTVNREVVYDDQAGHFDDLPDPLVERVESDLDRAQRAINTKASGPRVMKKLTRPAREFPRKGSDTEFYENIRKQVNEDAQERERVQALSPMRRFLHDRKRIVVAGSVVLAMLMVVGLITGIVKFVQYQTATVTGTVAVAELRWERSVEVEEYKTLTQSGWSRPNDARVQGNERKIRSWVTIHDGWRTEWYTVNESRPRTETYSGFDSRPRTETYSGTCTRTTNTGNGAFRTETYSCLKTRTVYDQVPVMKTRTVYDQVPVRKSRQVEITHQEPVWDIWYTYQVDRWVTDRWVQKSDTDGAKPFWPKDFELLQNSLPGDQAGEERVGDERKQEYTVVYVDTRGDRHTQSWRDDKVWSKLEKKEEVSASYRARNGDFVSVDWSSVK